MGARLLYFRCEWVTLTTDVFVRSIVRDGYRIELHYRPTISPVHIPMSLFPGSENSKALVRDITSLLDKQAIEGLDPRSLTPEFYIRIFLVPKKDGRCRPVFDLNPLNRFVSKEKFKMTTPRVVTNALHRGGWAVSVDLKDAYFHVTIHAKSTRLLRLALTDSNSERYSLV